MTTNWAHNNLPQIEFVGKSPIQLRLNPQFASEIKSKFGVRNSILMALLLHQLGFWIKTSKNEHTFKDNQYWTYQSVRDIHHKAFHFVSPTSIHRAIGKLRDNELIYVANYNKYKYDKTKWYSLNQEAIANFNSVQVLMDSARQRPYIHYVSDKHYRVSPKLATEIGLNESIVLLQLAYLIRIENNWQDGICIATQTKENLEKNFNFMSYSELNTTIRTLKQDEYIYVDKYFDRKRKKTIRSFALNTTKIDSLDSVCVKEKKISSGRHREITDLKDLYDDEYSDWEFN